MINVYGDKGEFQIEDINVTINNLFSRISEVERRRKVNWNKYILSTIIPDYSNWLILFESIKTIENKNSEAK